MNQEHRLVAELYRFVAPFTDTTCPIYLSLDGQAALRGVQQGHFADAIIPDIWISLLGRDRPMLIEAKTIRADGRVSLMQSQLQAWRGTGVQFHQPDYWVAVNEQFDQFLFWTHSDFLPALNSTHAQRRMVQFRPPAQALRFRRVSELALHILRMAS
jgi:hypothetical protein